MNRDNKLRFWVTLSNEFPDGDKVIGVEHSLDNCSADTIYMTECDDVGDAADQVVEYRDKAKEQWPDEEIYLSIFGDLAEFYGNNGVGVSQMEEAELYNITHIALKRLVDSHFPKCPHCGEYAYKLTWVADAYGDEKYCSEECANDVFEDNCKQQHKYELESSADELRSSVPQVLDILRSRYRYLEEGGEYSKDVEEAIDAFIEVMDNLPKEKEDEQIYDRTPPAV